MPKSSREKLLDMTKIELVEKAKEIGLKGFSRLNKEKLVELIRADERKSRTAAKKEKVASKPKKLRQGAKKERSRKAAGVKAETALGKAAAPRSKKMGVKTDDKESLPKNGLAIQHPSASPSARRYGRLDDKEPDPALAKALIWPDRDAIPERYGRDRLVTFVRDPNHIFCVWEISAERLSEFAGSMSEQNWLGRRMVLKVFLHTAGLPKLVLSTDVYGEVGRYHIEVPEPNKKYYVELGFHFPDGRYEILLADHPVLTPQVRQPMLGPVRWLHVKPLYTRRVISLDVAPSLHSSGAARGIRRSLADIVSERRKELGISDRPSSASEDAYRFPQEDGD
ncbi:DUF4912 domain-containing protein [bacterium]|nr:DUF4912 domain-containing protein [bacterium]